MIVIKDVETPKNCFECPFGFIDYRKRGVRKSFVCCITLKAMTSTKRNRFCPIVDGEEVEE